MTDTPPGAQQDDNDGHAWLNRATVNGALLVGFGLLVLMFPDASRPILRYGFGAALVLFAGSELFSYFTSRTDRPRSVYRLVSAGLAAAAGVGLWVSPGETTRVIEVVIGIWLILRGLTIISRAVGDEEIDNLVPIFRGVIYGGVGVAMFFAGDFLIDTLLVVAAVLALVSGLIMIGYGIQHSSEEADALDAGGVVAIVGAWLDDRELGEAKRVEVADSLYFEEPDQLHKFTSYGVMLVLSVSIATLAILQDSTAVVIGAMLIAPLMTPIMGTAAAIVNGWRGRMISSLILVAVSVGVAIVVAWIIATWAPALVPFGQNSQITSRVSPTLLDMAIALAAGAAGAYATVDDRVSSSLPGVAIAVALVPPLGVVGVALQADLFDDALGAFLLFSTNFVSIILASVVIFIATGFSPVRRFIDQRDQVINVLGTVVVGALLIMVPLGLTGASIINSATDQEKAQNTVQAWVDQSDTLELGSVTIDGDTVEINVGGTGPLPPFDDLESELSEELGQPVTVEVDYFQTARYTYTPDGGLQVTEPNSSP